MKRMYDQNLKKVKCQIFLTFTQASNASLKHRASGSRLWSNLNYADLVWGVEDNKPD